MSSVVASASASASAFAAAAASQQRSRQSAAPSKLGASTAQLQRAASVRAATPAASASASAAAAAASASGSRAASASRAAAQSRRQSNVTRIARDLLQLNASVAANSQQAASFAAASQAASQAASAALSLGLSAAATSRVASAAAASRLNGCGGGCSQQQQQAYLSELENLILNAQNEPAQIGGGGGGPQETEEIEVNGERGQLVNQAEVAAWRGDIPLSEYQINQDANPEVITKRAANQNLEYVQELAVRYLRPPTPPAPGEILIQQENDVCTGPAPPLIIRQQPARPVTPAPLVIREAPPPAPQPVGQKVISISGKRVPPPPRKVIIERLAALPTKPQSVLIERWLPYAQVKRRVIFQGPTCPCPEVVAPRNVVVQWEAPQVSVRKEVKYLGVIAANPADYVNQYGAELLASADLPEIVNEVPTPDGLVLAANYQYNELHELEGKKQHQQTRD